MNDINVRTRKLFDIFYFCVFLYFNIWVVKGWDLTWSYFLHQHTKNTKQAAAEIRLNIVEYYLLNHQFNAAKFYENSFVFFKTTDSSGNCFYTCCLCRYLKKLCYIRKVFTIPFYLFLKLFNIWQLITLIACFRTLSNRNIKNKSDLFKQIEK